MRKDLGSEWECSLCKATVQAQAENNNENLPKVEPRWGLLPRPHLSTDGGLMGISGKYDSPNHACPDCIESYKEWLEGMSDD